MEFVKTQYVIQMRERIYCIVHNDIFFKYNFFIIYSDMCCDMFFLLHCFAFAELKCFVVSPTLMCLLPNTLYYSGFLWIETQPNISCKWIICKRITEHSCWSVGLLLTHQSFAGVTIACLKSRYLANKTLFFLQIKRFINCVLRATSWQKKFCSGGNL